MIIEKLRGLRRWIGECRHWNLRIRDAVECPDNARLARVPGAGRVKGEFQLMHNGLKVLVNGYYGDGITRMLKANGGCHEPQEEVVFQALLRILPPGAVIVEGGSYWAFYSMWLLKEIANSKAYLIEPDIGNINVGARNLAENGLSADLTNAFVGEVATANAGEIPTVSVDSFTATHSLPHINVLHMDIQGAETAMLRGAHRTLTSQAVDYIFISTHSEALHLECIGQLEAYGYKVLTSVTPVQSFSYDGLIVSQRPAARHLFFEPISLKKTSF